MFAKVTEASISRAIVKTFTDWLHEYVTSDVIIVGGGPSGLIAGRDLARAGLKTLILESNNYVGGGFWVGGYFMNTLTFRAPSQDILAELKVRYHEPEKGLLTADGPETCSKLIAAACDAGAKILSLTKFDDVVLRGGRVEGVVVNWSAVSTLPKPIACLDPIALESKAVIDATGHDACVLKSLERRKLLRIEDFGAMDVCGSEDELVERTGEIFPGVFVTGMAVSTAYGIPRMGPTFGGMLYSGIRVAALVKGKVLTSTAV